MEDIITRMENFPAGGWDIDDFEDPGDWANDIKTLDSTKSLRQIRLSFKSLSTRIANVAEPEQTEDDDFESDDAGEGDAALSVPAKKEATTSESIRVKTKKTNQPAKMIDQHPPVRSSFRICVTFSMSRIV
jgi:hypothetical protein